LPETKQRSSSKHGLQAGRSTGIGELPGVKTLVIADHGQTVPDRTKDGRALGRR
jgi:hypothetical protein